jgi:threonine synthase
VTVAAARTLAAQGRLSPDDEIVLCITGNGLKTTDAVAGSLTVPEPIAPKLSEVSALIQS